MFLVVWQRIATRYGIKKRVWLLKIWLDELPFDYEDEDEKGNVIKKLDYPIDWEETDIKEHCQANEYLFDKYGKCVHQLQIFLNKLSYRTPLQFNY